MTLIEFTCREQRFGLPLECVRRVLPNALPASLPGAPAIVRGVLNVHGEVVTVLDFGARMGLPPVPLHPDQRLLLLPVRGFTVAFIVDEVLGVFERPDGIRDGVPASFAGGAFIDGVARLDDGLCLIVDPEQFLFREEQAMLRAALGRA